MNPTVEAALDAELASLSRLIDVPAPPLGWGRDLSCVADIRDDFAETDPLSPRGIAEAVVRRLISPRGSLLDDPDYGFDLRGMLNRGVTQDELRTLHTHILNEIVKDERVESATVRLTAIGSNPLETSFSVDVVLTPRDPDIAVFRFVVAMTSADVVLEVIGA